MRKANYYLITLDPDVDAEAFERDLLANVLPELHVLQRNVRDNSHALYKCEREGKSSQYLWVLTVDYYGGSGVGDVPEQMREVLKPYGTLSPPFAEVNSPGDTVR